MLKFVIVEIVLQSMFDKLYFDIQSALDSTKEVLAI